MTTSQGASATKTSSNTMMPRIRVLFAGAILSSYGISKVSSMKVVVVGGGIQGTSVAYHLAKLRQHDVTLVEAIGPASAASGKGGGFMARSWGDGGPTQQLHEMAFDMYENLAKDLGCTSFRKLPVLSVAPGKQKPKKSAGNGFIPGWLDGKVGRIRPMGYGDDTAQITPDEFVQAMLKAEASSIQQVRGQCVGVVVTPTTDDDSKPKVCGIKYKDPDTNMLTELDADVVVISAGPWSCQAEDWFEDVGLQVKLPMQGVKSTSIVWEAKDQVDATALFCGEDDRFGTHLEVYPRPDGTIYLCGIGGSDYIPTEDLKGGAFLDDCPPKPERVKAAMASFREMSASYSDAHLSKRQACMRPCPPDALPYMGPIPGCEGAYINAGHNCWGIAWAPACGKAMAELVTEGSCSSLDLSPFSPARFTKTRSNRGRKKRGVDVGEQW